MNISQQSPWVTTNPQSLGFDLEKWLLNLVMLNHPEWKHADGSCPECGVEVERMRDRADAVELLDTHDSQDGANSRAQY